MANNRQPLWSKVPGAEKLPKWKRRQLGDLILEQYEIQLNNKVSNLLGATHGDEFIGCREDSFLYSRYIQGASSAALRHSTGDILTRGV